jgi:hypothetical protein
MSKCMNCSTNITCNCQKRVATDGKTVCTTCIGKYEAEIKVKQLKRKQETT